MKDKPTRILIAEDDATTRQILAGVLKKLGYEVSVACDGAEAWESMRKSDAPKLLILDWVMPGMDGLTLCRKIREIQPGGYVYIIMLTAKESRNDVLAGFEAGADDYLPKPIDPDELKARLKVGQRVLDLEEAQKRAGLQLVQSEKMASVGQLAAGVAHEINNPTGFVSSNLKTLSNYQKDLSRLIVEYRTLVSTLIDPPPATGVPDMLAEQARAITAIESEIDIGFILKDIPDLIEESREGTERIKKIVMDLKDFAHPGMDKACEVDVNRGIESTLNVVWNELKYKATVTKELSDLPKIKGYPQQLNQVFMNILVNAAQAIPEKGELRIRTQASNGHVEIRIQDTGTGISPENLKRIFDPFFTTKEIGKGTGLGLHVVHSIVEKHKGTIDVASVIGEGTTFTINLPVDFEAA